MSRLAIYILFLLPLAGISQDAIFIPDVNTKPFFDINRQKSLKLVASTNTSIVSNQQNHISNRTYVNNSFRQVIYGIETEIECPAISHNHRYSFSGVLGYFWSFDSDNKAISIRVMPGYRINKYDYSTLVNRYTMIDTSVQISGNPGMVTSFNLDAGLYAKYKNLSVAFRTDHVNTPDETNDKSKVPVNYHFYAEFVLPTNRNISCYFRSYYAYLGRRYFLTSSNAYLIPELWTSVSSFDILIYIANYRITPGIFGGYMSANSGIAGLRLNIGLNNMNLSYSLGMIKSGSGQQLMNQIGISLIRDLRAPHRLSGSVNFL
jgi:hypothetical protein